MGARRLGTPTATTGADGVSASTRRAKFAISATRLATGPARRSVFAINCATTAQTRRTSTRCCAPCASSTTTASTRTRESSSGCRRQVAEGLKRFEFTLRRKVEDSQGDQPALTATDEVPRGYRDLVAEYDRSLSRTSQIEEAGSGFQVPLFWSFCCSPLRPTRRFGRAMTCGEGGAASRPASLLVLSKTAGSTSAVSCTPARTEKLAVRAGAPTIQAPTSTSASASPSSRRPPSAQTAKATPNISSSAAAATTTSSTVRSCTSRTPAPPSSPTRMSSSSGSTS